MAAEAAAMWGRPQDGVPAEERSGANACVYWVTTRLGGQLTRLPDVTPLQIKTARSIKKFLTGNLQVRAARRLSSVRVHVLGCHFDDIQRFYGACCTDFHGGRSVCRRQSGVRWPYSGLVSMSIGICPS